MSGVFIGDEVTALGYRLAGLQITAVRPEDAGAALEDARRAGASLVVLTAEFATRVDPASLSSMCRKGRPAVLIVPDTAGRAMPESIRAEMQTTLGIGP